MKTLDSNIRRFAKLGFIPKNNSYGVLSDIEFRRLFIISAAIIIALPHHSFPSPAVSSMARVISIKVRQYRSDLAFCSGVLVIVSSLRIPLSRQNLMYSLDSYSPPLSLRILLGFP